MPLPLFLFRSAILTYARIRKDDPITWEGMYANKNYSISHLRYWQLMADKLGLTILDVAMGHCNESAPDASYQVNLDSFQGGEEYLSSSGGHDVYTDGSKMRGKTGAAYQIRKREEVVVEHKFRLPDGATIHQAETFAVFEAAKTLLFYDEAQDVKFFVDCQPVLQALRSDRVISRLTQQTMTQLNQLHPAKVELVWVPAHKGTPGNEAADQLAKAGCSLDYLQELGQPIAELKAEVDRKI